VSDMNRSFAGSMPEFYDRFLVPVMFEPFAFDMASRLKGVQSGHVLEDGGGNWYCNPRPGGGVASLG
jgi:hypothetical protein